MTHRLIRHTVFIAVLLAASLVAPATAQTPPANVPQVPQRWDMNGDGIVDMDDVDIAAGDLAAMTSWLRMNGGSVSVTAK